MDWNRLIGSPAAGTYLNPTGSELAKVQAYGRDQARGAQELGGFVANLVPPTHFDPMAVAGYAVGNELTDRMTGASDPGVSGQVQPAQFTPSGLLGYLVSDPLRALAETGARLHAARQAALPPVPPPNPNYWAEMAAKRHAREGTASTVRPYRPSLPPAPQVANF